MSRTLVVKALWAYFKKHDLQDPKDRRYILCDAKLKAIFQKDRINAFKMNKDLSNHLKPKDEVTVASGGISTTTTTAASTPKPRPAKKSTTLSEDLQRLLGTVAHEVDAADAAKYKNLASLGRPQIVKLLWMYIRKHNLQDPNAKTTIICDSGFEQVFKVKSMNCFEMNKLLSQHIIRKE